MRHTNSLLALCVLWTFCCCCQPLGAQPPCVASEVWEKLIAAKGGRANLEDVRVFYVKEQEAATRLSFARRDIRTLYVMPRFFWQWDDTHTPMFGVTITQFDLDQGTMASLNTSSSFKPVFEKSMVPTKERVDDRVAAYLIETKWLKPVAVGCKIAQEEQRRVVLLEVEARGNRYVYHLDAKTYLPLRLSVPEEGLVWEHYLEGYRRVGEIMLPQHRRKVYDPLAPESFTVSYEINPQYDPDFRKLDLSYEAGPDAWRLKKQ
jgi:hypothetical protein